MPQPPNLPLDFVAVSAATGSDVQNCMLHWPLVWQAMQDAGCVSKANQIGLAATIAHETARTFKPIAERRAHPVRQRDLWLTQERYWPSGFYGRGFIQLTWFDNYRDCGEAIDQDLIEHPDLLLDPEVSAKAAVWYWTTWAKGRIPLACEKGDWPLVRKLVNGGSNGLAEFVGMVKAFGV